MGMPAFLSEFWEAHGSWPRDRTGANRFLVDVLVEIAKLREIDLEKNSGESAMAGPPLPDDAGGATEEDRWRAHHALLLLEPQYSPSFEDQPSGYSFKVTRQPAFDEPGSWSRARRLFKSMSEDEEKAAHAAAKIMETLANALAAGELKSRTRFHHETAFHDLTPEYWNVDSDVIAARFARGQGRRLTAVSTEPLGTDQLFIDSVSAMAFLARENGLNSVLLATRELDYLLGQPRNPSNTIMALERLMKEHYPGITDTNAAQLIEDARTRSTYDHRKGGRPPGAKSAR